MNEYFERGILYLEKEITRLKTSAQRSAALLATLSKTIPINAKLEIGTEPDPGAEKVAVKVYNFEIVTENDAIITSTLDWYYQDIYQAWRQPPTIYARYIDMVDIILPSGNPGIRMTVFGSNIGPNNDAERVQAGQEVIVSVNLTVRCSHDFIIREYR